MNNQVEKTRKTLAAFNELSPEQRSRLELQLQARRGRSPQTPVAAAASPARARSDEENLVLVESQDSVDQLLGKFYVRFPWPWQPIRLHVLNDPMFETTMLNQDLGDWDHQTLPEHPRIWVAGCGTNQALLTALKFPKAFVIGSDVSTSSLEICARNARELNVSNLELKQESINHVPYQDQFDYVISTGVIHHNADPQATLSRLVTALKPTGVLELMVYNRFHRTLSSAFQKAIRILGAGRGSVNFESDLTLARKLVNSFPAQNQMAEFLRQEGDGPESDFADLLIHPVEHSYTVESLEELGAGCGLELLHPCITPYVKFRSPSVMWNMQFDDPELEACYESLPDTHRWQATNLLLQEQSSLLWFYFQRTDSGRPRKSEQQICQEFLDRRFEKIHTTQSVLTRSEDGGYRRLPGSLAYPSALPDASVREIFSAHDPDLSMREIFRRLELDASFSVVNRARIHLTTSGFPYLKARQGDLK